MERFIAMAAKSAFDYALTLTTLMSGTLQPDSGKKSLPSVKPALPLNDLLVTIALRNRHPRVFQIFHAKNIEIKQNNAILISNNHDLPSQLQSKNKTVTQLLR